MVKPASKTKNTSQTRLGSVAKASMTGMKRSMPSKNIAAPISDKQKKSWGSSSHVTSLATTSIDKDADYIVD